MPINDNPFGENKAQEAIKKAQEGSYVNTEKDGSLDTLMSMESLLSKLNKTTEKANTFGERRKAGDKHINEGLSKIEALLKGKSTKVGADNHSEAGNATMELLEGIAKDSKKASALEQKELKKELVEMGSFLETLGLNDDEKSALIEIKDEISKGIDKNRSLLSKLPTRIATDFAGQTVGTLKDSMMDVFSDTPIVAMATSVLADGVKKVRERRQEKLRIRREKAQARLGVLSEAHARKLNEIVGSTNALDKDKEQKKSGGFAKANDKEESSENNKNILNSINGLLNDIANTMTGVASAIKEGNSLSKRGKEEARREAAFEKEELISAIKGIGGGSSGKDKKEGGIGEMFSGLVDSLGIPGLAGIGAALVAFKAGVGKAFGLVKNLFAPITAVVSLFSGIRDGINTFNETGSVLEGISEGIMGTADSILSIFTFGFLDLEKTTAFLTDWIPTSVSDAVFGAVDTVIDVFANPLDSLGSMFSGIGDLLLAPFKSVFSFFESDFGDVTDFLGDLKEKIYEWTASWIPDFLPDAVVPDSILKYKDSGAAMRVAEEDLKDFQENRDPDLYTRESILEEVKLRKKFEKAKLRDLQNQFDETGDEKLKLEMKATEENLARSNESIENITYRIAEDVEKANMEQVDPSSKKMIDVNDTKPMAALVTSQTINNISNELSASNLVKNDRTRLGEVIESNKEAVEKALAEKARATSGANNTSVNTQTSVVNNNKTTHVTNKPFNVDPSIMRPIIN